MSNLLLDGVNVDSVTPIEDYALGTRRDINVKITAADFGGGTVKLQTATAREDRSEISTDWIDILGTERTANDIFSISPLSPNFFLRAVLVGSTGADNVTVELGIM